MFSRRRSLEASPGVTPRQHPQASSPGVSTRQLHQASPPGVSKSPHVSPRRPQASPGVLRRFPDIPRRPQASSQLTYVIKIKTGVLELGWQIYLLSKTWALEIEKHEKGPWNGCFGWVGRQLIFQDLFITYILFIFHTLGILILKNPKKTKPQTPEPRLYPYVGSIQMIFFYLQMLILTRSLGSWKLMVFFFLCTGRNEKKQNAEWSPINNGKQIKAICFFT